MKRKEAFKLERLLILLFFFFFENFVGWAFSEDFVGINHFGWLVSLQRLKYSRKYAPSPKPRIKIFQLFSSDSTQIILLWLKNWTLNPFSIFKRFKILVVYSYVCFPLWLGAETFSYILHSIKKVQTCSFCGYKIIKNYKI